MYSILLVEDRILELDTLKNYVEWKSMGINQVYTARGGRSALACIAENEPDILLTDIQMPGMSGIELARLVREEGYRCRIIFLTGYDRFDYAKDAIRVQADDYLLKPVQFDELKRVIEDTIKKIEASRQSVDAQRMAYRRTLEEQCRGELNDAVCLTLSERWKDQNFGMAAVLGLPGKGWHAMEQHSELASGFRMGDLLIVVLWSVRPMAELAADLLQKEDRAKCRIAYTEEKLSFADLPEACSRLVRAGGGLFFRDPGSLISVSKLIGEECREEWTESEVRKARADVLSAAVDLKTDRIMTAAEYYMRGREICGRDTYCREGEELCRSIKWELARRQMLLSSAAEPELPDLIHSVSSTEVLEKMGEYIDTLVSSCVSAKLDWVTRSVLNYVGSHYREACTVEDMAEELGRSATTIRTRFRADMDQTVLEYVTEYRLLRAAELLKQQKLKVKEVSVMVGYENVPYFTQLFSRRFGVTPNEYKTMV